jgi:hypothetical protein
VIPRQASESVCLYPKPLALFELDARLDLPIRSAGRTVAVCGPRYPRARAPGPSPGHQADAVCPARRLRSGRPRGRRSGCRWRRGSGLVSLAGFLVSSAARACPAESSKATAVCKHPAAAGRVYHHLCSRGYPRRFLRAVFQDSRGHVDKEV